METSVASVETPREKRRVTRGRRGWAPHAVWGEAPGGHCPAEWTPRPVMGPYLVTHSLPEGTRFSPLGQNSP